MTKILLDKIEKKSFLKIELKIMFIKNNRYGQVFVSGEMIRENIDVVSEIFAKMKAVVLRCECNFASDNFDYIMYSPLFNEVQVGEMAPLYKIIVTETYNDKGEITNAPTDFISIHGKVYKLMSIAPCKGCHSIWIMYPKDSLDKQPEVINYNVSNGKTTKLETVIKVD